METRLLIGGELVAGDGAALAVEDPAREEPIAEVGTPDQAQLDAAIEAARTAQREWAGTPAAERAEALHEIASRMRARTDELAELMTREGGKPLVENRDEVGWTASAFDFYAELARTSEGRVIPPVETSQLALVLKEPLGVVTCIVPWNYPLLLLAWKLAPVLAAGNAALCKPSELTPLSTLALAPCVDHLPAGLVRCWPAAATSASGWSTTSASTASPSPAAWRPARGSPSGRRAVSRGSISSWAARTRSSSAPTWRDEIEIAARGGAWAAFLNAGQVCTSAERFYVERAVYDDFLERVRRAHAVAAGRRSDRPGDRRRPDGQRRPARQGARPGRGAVAAGAELLIGGDDAGHERGHYFAPAVVTGAAGRDRPAARGDLRPGGADRAGRRASTRRSSWPTGRRTGSAPTSTRATSRPRSAARASCAPARCGSTTR